MSDLDKNFPRSSGAGDLTGPHIHAMLKVGGLESSIRMKNHDWQPPTIEELQRALPQYDISAFVARGGMGVVYRGVQKSLRRTVAIKVLPAEVDHEDPQYAARFKQEAEAMARLSHPGIVGVFDAGETAGGLLYFVMEFMEGTDVAKLIASEGKLDPQRAVGITAAVLDALAFAHEEGIIHRDIKPSNIMLDKRGRVKVADFGLAKFITQDGAGFTRSDLALGTADFAAPETSIPGIKVDGRADIYAVGVMLYQMLTGRIPRGRFDSPSGIVPLLDPRLDAIVDKAMQTDREKRYASAATMKADVDRLLEAKEARGAGPPDSPVPLPAPSVPPSRRKVPLWAVGATMVALVAGSVIWMNSRGGAQKAGMSSVTAGGDSQQAGKSSAPTEPKKTGTETARDRWRPVPSKFNPRMDQGMVHLKNYDSWAAPRFHMGNVAVRTTIVWQPSPPGHNELIKVTVRLTVTEHYYACLYGPVVELGIYRAGKGMTGLNRWSVEPPPAPGEAVSLQLACIGRKLAVWVRDRLVGVMEDDALTEPANIGVQAVDGHIRSLEYLNLDGLPESEALKAAGVPLAHWRDALAEAPLKDVVAKAGYTDQGFLLPALNHWLVPVQALQDGAIRIRTTWEPGPFIQLQAAINDSIRYYRASINPQTRMARLSFVQSGEPDKVLAGRDDMSVTQGRSYDFMLARIAGHLWVVLDGDVLVQAAETDHSPVRFVLDCETFSKARVQKVEYIDLDGLPKTEALKLAGVPDSPSAPRTQASAYSAAPVTVLTFGGHRYQFVTGRFSWTEAKAKAGQMGGHLATLATKEEAEWAKKTYLTCRDTALWLGGYRTPDDKWHWITGEPWTYTDWARWKDGGSEPGNHAEGTGSASADYLELLWHSTYVPPGGWDDVRLEGTRDTMYQSGFLVEWDDPGNPAPPAAVK